MSRMSHELRTPRSAILGLGQLLDTDPSLDLAAAQREHLRAILRAGERLRLKLRMRSSKSTSPPSAAGRRLPS